MAFLPAQRIEARATDIWQRFGLQPGFDVERVIDLLGLQLLWEEVDDDVGGRVLGQLVPAQKLVVLNERHLGLLEEKGGRLRRYTVGHEIGHWELHADDVRSGTLSLFSNDRLWCRDGSAHPAERQAEMFAAALLMPRAELLDGLPPRGWSGWRPVYGLCDQFVVNATPMMIRLEQLRFAHRDDLGVPHSGPKPAIGQNALFDP